MDYRVNLAHHLWGDFRGHDTQHELLPDPTPLEMDPCVETSLPNRAFICRRPGNRKSPSPHENSQVARQPVPSSPHQEARTILEMLSLPMHLECFMAGRFAYGSAARNPQVEYRVPGTPPQLLRVRKGGCPLLVSGPMLAAICLVCGPGITPDRCAGFQLWIAGRVPVIGQPKSSAGCVQRNGVLRPGDHQRSKHKMRHHFTRWIDAPITDRLESSAGCLQRAILRSCDPPKAEDGRPSRLRVCFDQEAHLSYPGLSSHYADVKKITGGVRCL